MSKPSIPQGTRDFSPVEVRKRQHIFNTLRNIFELYGFEPLETPAMENLITLTGKYGEEGDRLIFKILNNGLNVQTDERKAKLNEEWNKVLQKSYSSPEITERALRYDLTIPFARFVVMHQNELSFPFRRYQMQPVWRADRPQKGRYREFWQCDADIVGSNSLINEAELICIYFEAFHRLGIPVTVKINNRKILAGMAEYCGIQNRLTELTIALDKIDKIGWTGVKEELTNREFGADAINKIEALSEGLLKNNVPGREFKGQLNDLANLLTVSEVGMQGINELKKVYDYFENLQKEDWFMKGVGGTGNKIEFSGFLARGLNYYTGTIVEVVCNDPNVKMGSIGGGGRYDDLTGLFGLKGLSGVGVSFGIDRIYDVLEELGDKFPVEMSTGAHVLVLNFGGENESYAISCVNQLRNAGIPSEVFPDAVKMDKQLKFANKRGYTYIIFTGEDERKNYKVTLKNFKTGEERKMIGMQEVIEITKEK